MCSSSQLPVIHHAGHGNAAEPTLAGMPPEITDHILRLTPDSVRVCRAVSRALRHTGEGFLQEHAQEIVRWCVGSPLHSLAHATWVNFSRHLPSRPDRSWLEFHFSIPGSIAAMGVPRERCPDRVLSQQEMGPLGVEVQKIQDDSLATFWSYSLVAQIRAVAPQFAEVPGFGESAQWTRPWMHENGPILQGMTRLDLHHRELKHMPEEICLFTGLQELDLSRNELTSLPEHLFQGMRELRKLDLASNQLTSVPEGLFRGLTGLRVIIFADNHQLTSLPEGLFRGLTGLQEISLFNCLLVSLPEGLFQGLVGLQGLDLSNNRLTPLPEGIFHGLVGLQRLTLRNNQLESLPQGLFQGLAELQELDLINIRLTSLSEDLFHGLANLQVISLNGNRLTFLPERLFHGLAGLHVLRLNQNQLTSLSVDLFQGLPQLGYLNLSDNQLVSLPEEIRVLKKPRLWGNPGFQDE